MRADKLRQRGIDWTQIFATTEVLPTAQHAQEKSQNPSVKIRQKMGV